MKNFIDEVQRPLIDGNHCVRICQYFSNGLAGIDRCHLFDKKIKYSFRTQETTRCYQCKKWFKDEE